MYYYALLKMCNISYQDMVEDYNFWILDQIQDNPFHHLEQVVVCHEFSFDFLLHMTYYKYFPMNSMCPIGNQL